jgi:diguanylate cyclase (GGDEF)-like protein/PAS domain S-box-containing protein
MKKDDQGAGSVELAWNERIERVCLRNLLASTNEAVYFKDVNSRFLLVSRGVVQHNIEHETRMGSSERVELSPEDFVGKTDQDLFDAPLALEWIAEEQRIMETGEPIVDVLERDISSDNQGGWFRTSKAPLRDDDGTIIGTFGISRDVTAQIEAEEDLVRREAQLRAVLDSSPDAIACYDQELRYEMVNAKAVALLGMASASIVGRTDAELGRPPEIVAPLLDGLRRVLDSKQMREVDYATEVDGATGWWHVRMVPHLTADGTVTGVITATRDLTELKAAQSVLARQALHDPLTGLVNRLALIDRLNHALAHLQRSSGRIALLFIDLDNFKLINDARGHDVGDRLLIEMASRLTRATRRADTVARLGGDEFVVLLDHLAAGDDAHARAARVLRSLSKPFVHRGVRLTLTASIGVVVTDDPRANAGKLLRDADLAMYRAKEKGRDRIEVFHPVLRDHANQRHRLALELRQAVEKRQFFLVYQPFYSLRSNSLVGVEALVRWQHPKRGVVPPGEFISLAEELGLINALGTWVLDEACRQLSQWALPDPCEAEFVMAVNVSAHQLVTPNFVDVVTTAIANHRISPSQLCLEITETGMIEELDRCRETLDALAATGARLALDDFGTGYSSLAHLQTFRVNTLKIDRSFVGRLGEGGSDGAIVAGVIAMAHALGMDVVAEGVETEEQLRKVMDMGCDKAQGYFFARPLSSDKIVSLLADQGLATSVQASVICPQASRNRGAPAPVGQQAPLVA